MAVSFDSFAGFETGGLEEISFTQGSPDPSETTIVRNGTFSCKMVGAATQALIILPARRGSDANNIITGFGVYFTDLTPGTEYLFWSSGFSLHLTTGGNVEILDFSSSLIGTITTPFTVNTWHFVEVYFVSSATVGQVEVFVDGISVHSTSADKNTGTGSTTQFGVSGPFSGDGTVYFDDLYLLRGATATSERLGDLEVFGYQNSVASATPNAGLRGISATVLDAGQWDDAGETPGSDAQVLSYDGTAEYGTVNLAGFGDEIDGDSNIRAILGIWRAEYTGGGGADFHYIGLGDSGDGDSAANQTISLTTTITEYLWFRATDLPTKAQTIRQGIANTAARNFDLYEMWAMIAHVPSAAGADHDLLADSLKTQAEVSKPTIGQKHVIGAAGLKSQAEVSKPAISQKHVIGAAGLKTQAEVSKPAVGQLHVIGAEGLKSQAKVSKPAAGEGNVLLAASLKAQAEVSKPAVGQKHVLGAAGLKSQAKVSKPTIGQLHVLGAAGLKAQAEVSKPTAGESNVLLAEGLKSQAKVSKPSVGQKHVIAAEGLKSQAKVDAPPLTQKHVLQAAGLKSQAKVSKPTAGESNALLAEGLKAQAKVSKPVIGQVHVIGAAGLKSQAEVSKPTLIENGVDALLAEGLKSQAKVSKPSIGQKHVITAAGLKSQAEVSKPTAAHRHVLTAASLKSQAKVSKPAISQVHAILGAALKVTTKVGSPALTQLHDLFAASLKSQAEVSRPTLSEKLFTAGNLNVFTARERTTTRTAAERDTVFGSAPRRGGWEAKG